MTKIVDGDGYDDDVNLILDDKDYNDDNCDDQDDDVGNETVVVAVGVVGAGVGVSAAANDDGDDVYDDSSLLVADEDCVEGWTRYYSYSGGNCYLFVREKVTFDEGQAECEKKDARLFDLHDEAENSFVASNMMME